MDLFHTLARDFLSSKPSPLPSSEPVTGQDLVAGLEAVPARIPARYLFDEQGQRFFPCLARETNSYMARAEAEILRQTGPLVLSSFESARPLNVIELEARSSNQETAHLLAQAVKTFVKTVYRPVGRSRRALGSLRSQLLSAQPGLSVEPGVLDLDAGWNEFPVRRQEAHLVLHLGSRLGHLTPLEQRRFLRHLRSRLHPGDLVLIGFDLRKDPCFLREAHEKISHRHVQNFFARLNRDWGADFDERQFRHMVLCHPHSGAVESWLISRQDQTVELKKLGLRRRWRSFEGLLVDVSWKFTLAEINSLALLSGFESRGRFFDSRKGFAHEIWACTPHGAIF